MQRALRFLVLLVSMCGAQLAYGGWNAAIRKNCVPLFKRYRVDVHAGYVFIPLGSSVAAVLRTPDRCAAN